MWKEKTLSRPAPLNTVFNWHFLLRSREASPFSALLAKKKDPDIPLFFFLFGCLKVMCFLFEQGNHQKSTLHPLPFGTEQKRWFFLLFSKKTSGFVRSTSQICKGLTKTTFSKAGRSGGKKANPLLISKRDFLW